MSKKSRTLSVADISVDFEVRIIQDEDFTVCEIWTDDPENEELSLMLSKGSARRDPADDVNLRIGNKLAMGRAFEKMGRRLLKQANGLVKHADDVRGQ